MVMTYCKFFSESSLQFYCIFEKYKFCLSKLQGSLIKPYVIIITKLCINLKILGTSIEIRYLYT